MNSKCIILQKKRSLYSILRKLFWVFSGKNPTGTPFWELVISTTSLIAWPHRYVYLQTTVLSIDSLTPLRTRYYFKKDLDALDKWSITRGMKFNPSKCNIITPSRGQSKQLKFYTMCLGTCPKGQVSRGNLEWRPSMGKTHKFHCGQVGEYPRVT